MNSDRHVRGTPAERPALCQGRPAETSLGRLPTPGVCPKLDPYVQLVEGDTWLLSAFLSILE